MPPKRAVFNHVQDGEVLLVDKEAVLPQKVMELSHKQADKLRPRAPRTEAQIANTKRLVELNKKRASEWRSRLTPQTEEIDEKIPEDKVAIKIKPKQPYVRKAPVWNTSALDAPPVPPVPKPLPSPEPPATPPAPKPKRKAPVRQPVSYYETEESESESEEEDIPQPLPLKKKRLQKSGKRLHSDTSETSDTTDSEMARVQKYVHKANARMDAVKKIDERLKQVTNKYANMSVF